MDEKLLKAAYNAFTNGGYNDSYNDFIELIKSNPEARNDAYSIVSGMGFQGDQSEFDSMIATGASQAPAPLKKKEQSSLAPQPKSGDSESSLDPTSSVSQGFKPAFGEPTPQREYSNIPIIPKSKAQISTEVAKTKKEIATTAKYYADQQAALKKKEQMDRAMQEKLRRESLANTNFNQDIVQLDPNLIKKDETEVVPLLNQKFAPYGFIAEEGFGDEIIVRTRDGRKSIKIELDNFTEAGDLLESTKLKEFINANAKPVGDPRAKAEDFYTQSKKAQNLRKVGRLNPDGSQSTVMMMSMGNYAVPTLFPKDPNNYSSDPSTWIELDGMEAFNMAKERGELFYFQDEKDAMRFAEGAWKGATRIDAEGQEFYKKKGLDYFQEKERWNEYESVRDKLLLIDELKDGTRFGNKEQIAKHPDLFIAGKLRNDIDQYEERLRQQEDELFGNVFDEGFLTEGKVQRAREEFDVYKDKKGKEVAQEAVVINLDAKKSMDELNAQSLDFFGVNASELSKITPTTAQEVEVLNDLKDRYVAEESRMKYAANLYEQANTYFSEKSNAQIREGYNENFSGFLSAVENGYARGKAGEIILAAQLGLLNIDEDTDKEEAAREIAQAMMDAESSGTSLILDRFFGAKGFSESLDVLADNPIELATSLAANSLSQMLPYGMKIVPAAVATGAAAGAANGAIFGAQGAGAGAIAGGLSGFRAGQSAVNFSLEYTNAILDEMNTRGYDITDPLQVEAALSDKSVWDAGSQRGIKRGIPIAIVDYLTAGMAGKVIKPSQMASKGTKIAAGAAERLVIDPLGEAAGETAAQVAEGKEDIDWKEVSAEALGGIGNNASNAAVNSYRVARNNNNVSTAYDMMNISKVAAETTSDSRITEWANNMQRLGKISPEMNQAIQVNVGLKREAKDLLTVGKKKADPKAVARTMELLAAREELTKTDNRKQVYRDRISSINNELSEISATGEVRAQEEQTPVYDIIGEGTKKVGKYVIDNVMLTREEFLNQLGKMKNKGLLRTRIFVENDDEIDEVLRLKQKAAFDAAPEDVKKKLTERGVAEYFSRDKQTPQQDIENPLSLFSLTERPQNAVQEQTTSEVPIQPEARVGEEVAQGTPQAEPQVATQEDIEEEVAPPLLTMQEALDDASGVYVLDGKKGNLTVVDGNILAFESDDQIIDLGPIDQISDSPIDDFGITFEPELDLVLNDDNSITYNGVNYYNNFSDPEAAFDKDKDGNYSVRLETETGQKRTFRGQQADQIVYQTRLKNFEQNATDEQIESANTLADEAIRTEEQARETAPKRKGKVVRKGSRRQRALKQPSKITRRDEAETPSEPVSIAPPAPATTEATPAPKRKTPKNKEQRNNAARKGEMVYHGWMDVVVESTPEQYEEALKEIAETGTIEDIFKYGKQISKKQAPFGDLMGSTLLNMTKESAEDELQSRRPTAAPAPAPASETKTEEQIANEKLKELGKRKVKRGKGSWRKAFNESKDPFKKSDILRAIAQVSTDVNEQADILEAAIGMPEESNIIEEIKRKRPTPATATRTDIDDGLDEFNKSIGRVKEEVDTDKDEQTLMELGEKIARAKKKIATADDADAAIEEFKKAQKERDDFQNSIEKKKEFDKVNDLIADEIYASKKANYEYQELFNQDPRLAAIQSAKDIIEFGKQDFLDEARVEMYENDIRILEEDIAKFPVKESAPAVTEATPAKEPAKVEPKAKTTKEKAPVKEVPTVDKAQKKIDGINEEIKRLEDENRSYEREIEDYEEEIKSNIPYNYREELAEIKKDNDALKGKKMSREEREEAKEEIEARKEEAKENRDDQLEYYRDLISEAKSEIKRNNKAITKLKNQLEPLQEVTSDPIESLAKLDPKDPGVLQKTMDFLDSIDNKITQQGKESLGVNIALPVLQVMVKAVKVLVKGGMMLEDAMAQVAARNNITLEDFKQALKNLAAKKKPTTKLKEEINDEIRSFKQGKLDVNQKRKALGQLIKNMVTKGDITTRQAQILIDKISKLNLDNPVLVDRFVEYASKVFDNAEYEQQLTDIRGKLPTARKNIQTKIGTSPVLTPILKKLFSINPTLIPDEVFDDYKELVDEIGVRKAVVQLSDAVQLIDKTTRVLNAVAEEQTTARDLMNRLMNYDSAVMTEENSLDYAATIKSMLDDDTITQEEYDLMKKYKSLILPRPVKLGKTKEEIQEQKDELIDVIDNTPITYDNLSSDDEVRTATELYKLAKSPVVQYLSVSELENLLLVIDNINNGYLPAQANTLLVTLNSYKNAVKLSRAVDKAKIPTPTALSAKYIKSSGREAILFGIKKTPLYNVDEFFGDFVTKDIFNSVFDKLASNEQQYSAQISKIDEQMEIALNNISKSYKEDANKVIEAKMKMQVYRIQREYESNPGDSRVRPALPYINATIEATKDGKTMYNERDSDFLESIKDEYGITNNKGEVTGIDNEKLFNSFNEAERKALDLFDRINKSVEGKAVFTADVIRNNKIELLNNYNHISVLPTTNQNTDALAEALSGFSPENVVSTKAKSLLERTGKVAPINMDVFTTVQRGAKFVLLDYYMTNPVREARKTINSTKQVLQEQGKLTRENRDIVNAIDGAIELSLETMLSSSVVRDTMADQVLKELARTGYRSMLAGVPRAVTELTSNMAYVAFVGAKEYKAGLDEIGVGRLIQGGSLPDVMLNAGSRVTTRVVGSDLLTGRMVDANALKKRTGLGASSARNPIANKSLQIHNLTTKKVKSGVDTIADTLVSTPDKIMMRPLWVGSFKLAFKGLTNTEVDFEKIADNDPVYMAQNREAIAAATKVADDKVVMAGNVENPFMGSLSRYTKADASTLKKGYDLFNNYMNKFMIGEYLVARKAVYAMMGKGNISKKEGVKLMAAVISRMTLYSTMVPMISSAFYGMFVDDEDDDDDKTFLQRFGQGLTSSLTSLILGRDYGNVARAFVNYGVERMNENYLDFLRNGDYDPYKDAIQYTIIPPEQRGKKIELSDILINMSGPYAPSLKTAEFAVKKMTEEDKKKEGAIERQEMEKKVRLPVEIFGNIGYVPFYKDVRAIVNKTIYKELDKELKAKKQAEGEEEFKPMGLNKTDLKRYYPEIYEEYYGEGTEYDAQKKLEYEKDRLEQQIKDERYDYIPKERSSGKFGGKKFGSGSGKSSGGFGSRKFGGD